MDLQIALSRLVARQRLLRNHVDVVVERAADVAGMRVVGRCDDEAVGPRLVQHAVELVGVVARHGRQTGAFDTFGVDRHAMGVGVGESDEPSGGGVAARQGANEHAGAVARPDQCIASAGIHAHGALFNMEIDMRSVADPTSPNCCAGGSSLTGTSISTKRLEKSKGEVDEVW